MMGNAYLMLNDVPAALPHARAFIDMAPRFCWAHKMLALVYAGLGESDKALAEINEAVRLIDRPHDSRNHYIFWMRGDLYTNGGQFAAALADYDRAIELSPASSVSYKRRAAAHFHLGNYPAALADIAKAVDLNPGDASNVTWIPPGEVAACPDAAFRRGVIDQATRALALTHGSPDAYASRASIYSAMKEDAKAVDDWAKAVAGYRRRLDELRGKPGYEDTLTAMAGLQATQGFTLLQRGRYADAEPVLRECLATRERLIPDDWRRFNAMSLLGGALLGQGEYAQAEPLLLQGYEGMKPREARIPPPGKQRLPEAVERIVELYEVTNRPEKAREWRQKLPPEPAPPRAVELKNP
jgi:tetratricopeptide (TPR) repeat protein